MKTFIINGSPRRNGGTSSIVAKLRESLRGEVTVLETYRCGISPCVDCRHCWTHAACAIDDGMREAYVQIDEADNIVIASPVYFAELTGPLLSWASRLQFFWTAAHFRHAPALRDRKRLGAVILVDGGDGCHEPALAMGKRLLRLMGAEYADSIYFSGTDKTEASNPLDDRAVLEAIERLAARMNREGER